jgi:hypothetical protein
MEWSRSISAASRLTASTLEPEMVFSVTSEVIRDENILVKY